MLNILVHCDSIHGNYVKALHGLCNRACKYSYIVHCGGIHRNYVKALHGVCNRAL